MHKKSARSRVHMDTNLQSKLRFYLKYQPAATLVDLNAKHLQTY